MVKNNIKLFEVAISELRPTQASVGYKEIEDKVIKYSKLSKAELYRFMQSKSIPVVLGPENKYYLVDRHHNCVAYLKMGLKKAICKQVADFSHLNPNEFWEALKVCKWAFLKDKDFNDINYLEIPKSVSKLPDNIYRSFVYFLIENKVVDKNESVMFFEFFLAEKIKSSIGNLNDVNFSYYLSNQKEKVQFIL